MDVEKLVAVISTVLSIIDLARMTEYKDKVNEYIEEYDELEEALLDLVKNEFPDYLEYSSMHPNEVRKLKESIIYETLMI